MGVASGLLVYALIWGIVFFMALPIGVRTAEEAGETLEPGQAESAPVRPRLWLKAGITTLVAGLLWAVYYLVRKYDLLGFREFVGQASLLSDLDMITGGEPFGGLSLADGGLLLAILPPGAFFSLALAVAAKNAIDKKRRSAQKSGIARRSRRVGKA